MRTAGLILIVGSCVVAWLSGCGSNVDFDDSGEPCEDIAPACPGAEVEVDACSNDTCHTITTCNGSIQCEEILGTCLAYPSCDPGDVEVSACSQPDCYESSICGVTIYCEEGPNCLAQPVCDPGDIEISTPCPPDVSCYSVTECGSTITCIDEWPEQGCPPAPPPEGSACEDIGTFKSCTYLTSPGCFEFYSCDQAFDTKAWVWSFTGGGCDGSGS
jgi:hypothetical protein